MPIEVRCPNPDCDRVHRVKRKYAGMRGRCPDCGGWMLIPRTGGRPAAVQRPGQMLAPAENWGDSVPDIDVPQKNNKANSPVARKRPKPVEADEDETASADQVEKGATPARHFSIFALMILFLATLALGGVGAVTLPFVEQPQIHLTGDLVDSPLKTQKLGVKDEGAYYLNLLPGIAAGLTFLAFLMALVRGKFGFLSLGPAYLALPVAWGMAVLAGFIFKDHLEIMPKLEKQAQSIRLDGTKTGEVKISWGQSLFVGLGCAGGGFLLLTFAMFFMHRSLGARLLFFFLVLLLLAGGGVVIFAGELGLPKLIPIDV